MALPQFAWAQSQLLLGSANNYVGIGTPTPVTTLHVSGTNTTLFGVVGNEAIYTSDAQGTNIGGMLSLGGQNKSGAAFNPYVFANIAGRKVNGTDSDYSGYLQFATTNAAGSSLEHMRIDQAGNVGIANTSPSYVLDVTGEARFTGGYTTSDRRLKTNIGDLGYGLDAVMKLRPVFFNWKKPVKGEEGRRVGLIAQEVEQVIPEVVSIAPDKMKTESVEYGNVMPVLVKAIQELKADNDNLRARLDALEAARQ